MLTSVRPKSTFQIGGAGAVGTGSLRGMPHLLTLREAGCAVWPSMCLPVSRHRGDLSAMVHGDGNQESRGVSRPRISTQSRGLASCTSTRGGTF